MSKTKIIIFYVGLMYAVFFVALFTHSHIFIGIAGVMFIALFYYVLYKHYKEIK